MSKIQWLAVFGLAGLLAAATAPAAQAQARGRPYIGFVYPAGGQQGTSFEIKMGGQGLDGVNQVIVSGAGVSAKVIEYHRKLTPQDMSLLREQRNELKRAKASADEAKLKLIAKIEKRFAEYVQRPACASLSSLVFVQVTMAADAKPGPRELRLATPRGVSNPLVFHVGQLPEFGRKPMKTAMYQVLGKEELALRKRPDEEVEQRITLPCTINGQIASGEVNRYRFEARKGQRLVFSAQARQLIPYIADAVPGWFQPVMAIHNAQGKEMAYSDDYRFKPDPVILLEVPEDGEYVLTMADAIHRGREDFVYRVTMGELPFVTSLFPLGGPAGAVPAIKMQGWNLEKASLAPPPADAAPGIYSLAAVGGGLASNRLPFAVDTLPEVFDKEPNNDTAHAQKVELPVIVNGRVGRADDWDVFQITGRAGEKIVAEVSARRLDSPLDSVLKITDASGKLLAYNDDHEDPQSGVNTHHADSYLMFELPADGIYSIHLGDAARFGGDEYAYRLRISAPRPDFALLVVPSSTAYRGKGSGAISVQVVRKEGFTGAIKLGLKDPPAGFSAPISKVPDSATTGRIGVKTNLIETKDAVCLRIEGRAEIDGREVAHEAVPAEDRMQAFLWRHLVPAEELCALVFDTSKDPPPQRRVRIPPPKPGDEKKEKVIPVDPKTGKPKFTRQQVVGRLRQIRTLFDEGLITKDFNDRKIAECEAAL